MRRGALVIAAALVCSAPAEAHRLAFSVPAHSRVIKVGTVRPNGNRNTNWTRIAINGRPLSVGDCYRTVCFMYGEGVVVRIKNDSHAVRIAVSSERAHRVRVVARYTFS